MAKYEVYVEGKYGDIDEAQMDDLSSALLGERIGSGCSLPDMTRDIQYQFSTNLRARSFIKVARTIKGVTSCTLDK